MLDGSCRRIDAGLSGLFNTLAAKGLLESTAVMVTGEFGRTPKINERAGRDHWPRRPCGRRRPAETKQENFDAFSFPAES